MTKRKIPEDFKESDPKRSYAKSSSVHPEELNSPHIKDIEYKMFTDPESFTPTVKLICKFNSNLNSK